MRIFLTIVICMILFNRCSKNNLIENARKNGMLRYKLEVVTYCVDNKIYIDFDLIDSNYVHNQQLKP